MIKLERLKSIPAGELVIYEAPGQPGRFYSGRVLGQPEGLTEPKHLHLIPADKRLKPIQFAIGDTTIGRPVHLVTELAYNSGVAFQVSEEDLRGSRDLSQDLHAQAKGIDLRTELAVDYLLEQLAEIRKNFVPGQPCQD